MPVASEAGLLADEHFQKCRAVLVALQLFEQGFLRLCHRTADTVPPAFELANVYTRAWRLFLR